MVSGDGGLKFRVNPLKGTNLGVAFLWPPNGKTLQTV